MVDKKIYSLINRDEPIDIIIIETEAHEKFLLPRHPKMKPIIFEILLRVEHKERITIPVMVGGRLVNMNVHKFLDEVSIEFCLDNPLDIRIGFCPEQYSVQPPAQSLSPSTQTNPQPKFMVAVKNILALPKPLGHQSQVKVFMKLSRNERKSMGLVYRFYVCV